MNNQTLITSSGIIKNRDIPRVGIVSIHSLDSFVFDLIDQGIDIAYEQFLHELKLIGIEEDSEDFYKNIDSYANDCREVLFGNWIKTKSGHYIPDTNGDFSAIYNSDSGIVTVEYSKHVTWCNNTSPCYMMTNGDGPCGDLDSKGSTVLAYSLPSQFFRKE